MKMNSDFARIRKMRRIRWGVYAVFGLCAALLVYDYHHRQWLGVAFFILLAMFNGWNLVRLNRIIRAAEIEYKNATQYWSTSEHRPVA